MRVLGVKGVVLRYGPFSTALYRVSVFVIHDELQMSIRFVVNMDDVFRSDDPAGTFNPDFEVAWRQDDFVRSPSICFGFKSLITAGSDHQKRLEQGLRDGLAVRGTRALP